VTGGGVVLSRISASLNIVLFLGKNQRANFDSLTSLRNEKLLSSFEFFIIAYNALESGRESDFVAPDCACRGKVTS